MGHVDTYRCDRKRCGAEVPAEYMPLSDGLSGPRPPREWLSLDGRLYGCHWTFCSLACLAIWARMEREKTA